MCDSLGLWLLSALGLSLVSLGVILWLYGRACEKLHSYAALEDVVREIGSLDAAWGDLRRFLGLMS